MLLTASVCTENVKKTPILLMTGREKSAFDGSAVSEFLPLANWGSSHEILSIQKRKMQQNQTLESQVGKLL